MALILIEKSEEESSEIKVKQSEAVLDFLKKRAVTHASCSLLDSGTNVLHN